MYPLVPLVSNIWGLVFQLLLEESKITYENNLPLSLLDIIFGGLQGFFVSIVFFSDPTMVDLIKSKVKHLKCRHGSTHEQSEARLITPVSSFSSFKGSFILAPPPALHERSYRDSSCCENSQETISQIPAACDVGPIPSKSERRVSLASEYTIVI
ncbi:uncharacterized protein EV154DRAFT_566285 [Mucor mucedo]|uniref:uncharacterized protein n=1 Tax=Mucor mucedo TaxID=29922 RepID=UPI00221E5106|nr:uncharacterized protein EV154DRAFT_566285 [Mucor mucedo]KAI7888528.1 hypothetical protein EV154DRAFT_566285 [Mucor mucedo]